MHYYYGTARLKGGRGDVPRFSAGPPPTLGFSCAWIRTVAIKQSFHMDPRPHVPQSRPDIQSIKLLEAPL